MKRDQAFEIYSKYLTTSWPNHEGNLKTPINKKLFTNMLKVSEDYKNQQSAGPSTLEKALKNKRRVLFWSDTHFFHSNIIKYASRPDTDADSMNERLYINYFNTVKQDDIVLWGGDCAFGNSARARDYFLSKNFPGYKILIMGNHDFDKKNDEWRDMKIFNEVMLCDGFDLEVDGVNKQILFTHYPIDKSLLPSDAINVHGHIHEKNLGYPWVNLSVEVVGYKPQTLDYCLEIAKSIAPKKVIAPSYM